MPAQASTPDIRPYRRSDQAGVIRLFRGFMHELTPPALQAEFAAYTETAVREELSRIDAYCPATTIKSCLVTPAFDACRSKRMEARHARPD